MEASPQRHEAGGGGRPALDARFFLSPQGWPYLLVPLIPIAVVLEIAHASAGLI